VSSAAVMLDIGERNVSDMKLLYHRIMNLCLHPYTRISGKPDRILFLDMTRKALEKDASNACVRCSGNVFTKLLTHRHRKRRLTTEELLEAVFPLLSDPKLYKEDNPRKEDRRRGSGLWDPRVVRE
jgi:hypothetical protein